MLESVETQLWVTKAVRQRIKSLGPQQQNTNDQNRPSTESWKSAEDLQAYSDIDLCHFKHFLSLVL